MEKLQMFAAWSANSAAAATGASCGAADPTPETAAPAPSCGASE